MLSGIVRIYLSLRYSFWFLPSLLVLGAFLLSLLMVAADELVGSREWTLPRIIYQGGPEGARALLSTVAGSMISVTGITFSITIVALTLASSQFGPRLLRNFMRDPRNQAVLGIFLATFVYCLMVLRRVRGVEDTAFVPHLAVAVGLVLALGSLGFLIFFIHHVAQSIQAENVIAGVSRDLDSAIDKCYPKMIGKALDSHSTLDKESMPEVAAEKIREVVARSGGYVQAIEGTGLIELAQETGMTLHIICRPGDFVFAGSPLLRAWPADRLSEQIEEAINERFLLGNQRTGEQDIEYAAHQLVEIALRALSPGINDSFTAINCVDRLGAALADLATRKPPSGFRYDEDDHLRVITRVVTFEEMLDTAFDQIRQCARTNAAVTIRLLEIIGDIACHARMPKHREALLRQAEMIERGSHDGIPEEEDRENVQQRFKKAINLLEHR